MIQRIQSLYLVIVVVLSALLLKLPVYEFPDVSTPASVSADGLSMKTYSISDSVPLSIINGTVGVLALISIFLFGNRNLQIRICNLNLLLLCILVGLMFFLADTMGTSFDHRLRYRYGSYLPLIQLVFTFLAGKAIRKDENLVRSADRLR